jgi:restriction endonuclease S subunit
LLPDYLGHSFYYHSQKNGFSDIVSSKSTIAHLPGDKLKAMNIIVPPMELQKRFIAFLEQSDKSKFELKESIKKMDGLIKSLIQNENQ